MLARWLTFLVWTVAVASGVAWGLLIAVHPDPLPDSVQVPAPASASGGSWAQVLGVVRPRETAAPEAPPESSRFALLGVVAARNGASGGLALVSVGGAPAKVWRTGQAVEGNTTLLAVGPRSAEFGPASGPARFTLQLPAQPAANAAVAHPGGAAARPLGLPPGVLGGPSALRPGRPPGALGSQVVGPTVPGGIGADGESTANEP
jgi:general secretion pathway protein C